MSTEIDDEETPVESKKNKDAPNFTKFGNTLWQNLIWVTVVVVIIGSVTLYTAKIAGLDGALPTADINGINLGIRPSQKLPDNMPLGSDHVEFNRTNIYGGIWDSLGDLIAKMFGKTPTQTTTDDVNFNPAKIADDFNTTPLMTFLNWISQAKDKPSCVFTYVRNIFVDVLCNNNAIINTILGAANANLSESVIFVLLPVFYIIMAIVLFFVNIGLFIYYHVIEVANTIYALFLAKNTQNSDSPGIFMVVVTTFLYWACIASWGVFSVMPFATILTSLLTPLSAKGTKTTASDSAQSYGFWSFFGDLLKYKSQLIMFLFTFVTAKATYKVLGMSYLLTCLIAIGILIFATPIFSKFTASMSMMKQQSGLTNTYAPYPYNERTRARPEPKPESPDTLSPTTMMNNEYSQESMGHDSGFNAKEFNRAVDEQLTSQFNERAPSMVFKAKKPVEIEHPTILNSPIPTPALVPTPAPGQTLSTLTPAPGQTLSTLTPAPVQTSTENISNKLTTHTSPTHTSPTHTSPQTTILNPPSLVAPPNSPAGSLTTNETISAKTTKTDQTNPENPDIVGGDRQKHRTHRNRRTRSKLIF